MPPLLQRIQKSDRGVEKRVVTSLIVSDKVISELYPFLKPELFELEVSQTVVRWALEYYDQWRSAPKTQIKDLFEFHKQEVKLTLSEEISGFLAKLSE